LPRQADGGQLAVGAGHFAQGGLLGSGHQHQAGTRRVGQRVDGRLVLAALLLQPGQRAEAGGIALALLQKAAPGARQLQQADGVAGGRGVENDVVEVGRVRCASTSRAVNSSKAAISVVQAPESCSSMPRTTASGSTPRTGPTMRSR
jgi:hypothetical protein